jgi:RsmE family RNA methyltransferase
MNRILFETSEISGGVAGFGGARARHVVEILHGEVGQIIKTGEIDGPVGTSRIESVEKTGDGYLIRAKIEHNGIALPPWVDLILAPPRPRVLKRLLPQLVSMGVGRIFLVGAKKVEKDFWGATLLKPEIYRPLLIEGLMQAGTSALPVIETRRNFRRFITDELDCAFPDAGRRVVAHPYGADSSPVAGEGRLLLAVGPEGGWTDDEVALLESRGFVRYSLGARILRTDTALIALLAKLGG